MNRALLFSCLLPLTLNFANESPVLKTQINAKQQSDISIYLRDLEELGYCVIPNVISRTETEFLYQRVWHEYIEKAWPNCRMDDRSNWKETFPMHNELGIFSGSAGQTQVMWDLRQDPRIVRVSAQIWNTSELIVSMDGLSFMCPPEIREEGRQDSWPHVDQAIMRGQEGVAHSNNPPANFVSESSLKTQPFTIQGQFLFEDSFDGDGGFYCIPRSHHRFNEFAPNLEALSTLDLPRKEKSEVKHAYLMGFFARSFDETGNPYASKQVAASKGSLILWDSRTVHWNQRATKDRPNPRVRMVGYLCYVPKARLTGEGRDLRRKAFETGASTGHNPAWPQLKITKNVIREEFLRYLEDSSYVQPKIHLTPLGEALLGLK